METRSTHRNIPNVCSDLIRTNLLPLETSRTLASIHDQFATECALEDTMSTIRNSPLCRRNRRLARQKWGLERNDPLLAALKSLTEDLALSVSAGDVILLQGN